ncbi:hypothetical protein IWX81_002585 [Salinibacterium sp. CAN_S4]|uniref:hypothetical protein n=1 Tax=Salinibacterium sp. CAN_S4 TaxID=2787727 RepID=UPI0018F043E4
MNPEELTAVATAWGVAVAALVGASGLVVGIIGLAQARKAKRAAATANEISQESNTIAKDANALAEVANRVIHEQAERETERSDVAWEWRWDFDSKGHVIIQNIGKNAANEVIAQFFFDTSTEANDYPIEIEGRDLLRLQIPELGKRREAALLAERRSVERSVDQRFTLPIPEPVGTTARVRLRVTWLTPKGTPKLHDTGYSDESLLHNAH